MQQLNNKVRCGMVVMGLLLNGQVLAADNMRLHGALVTGPCVIAPGDENVQLDFSVVADKYLYLNGRIAGQQFQLHLTDCDINAGNSVKVAFSGVENTQLPGLLALSKGSKASGIAIGLETTAGKGIPLNNNPAIVQELSNGNNVITLQAYVQAEPEAMNNHTIGRGAFSATVNFDMEYD
ncbi:fimbrial protein [Yersinia kristensenii]|uniref:fimbrial protein n=1 Tax=Yersinia kristensenii TaxID=28152 RepID=UPI001C608525|nr:fimbrial protein [Yersinia kristensenii]MBW5812532.1 fimbrial protein [Yersinia kristensenii]MBW5829833.1 fimbrial protein [Yersinia kristensenii]MDA5490312.1 fimbrial protein [Yersinia kristensenii]